MEKKAKKAKANKRNAVLFKEMTVDMKKPKIFIIMLLVNLGLIPIAIGFAIGMYAGGYNGVLSYRILAAYFIALIYIEASILLFITPAITAGSISLEKERQTLDVLLTTRLTTWEIIKGKYLSNYVMLALMVLSSLPLISLVFIYGGISFWQMIYVFIALFIYIAFLSSFGIFFSTLTKNTIVSVILTYLVVFSYMSITAILPWICVGGIEIINSIMYEDNKLFYFVTTEHLINGDYFLMLGVFNPFYMIFDVIGHSIGYSFDGYGIEGMNSCGEFLVHVSSKNWILRAWTPVSMVVQLLITYIVLRISGVILNPVKTKAKKTKNKRK